MNIWFNFFKLIFYYSLFELISIYTFDKKNVLNNVFKQHFKFKCEYK